MDKAKAAPPCVEAVVLATGEHRIGLKPIRRRVRAPCGHRPEAVGHHRFGRLCVTAFVASATGESPQTVSKEPFEATRALFAREAGTGPDLLVVPVLENAGWHRQSGLRVPGSIRLVHLPPYRPELQPAETLSGPCCWFSLASALSRIKFRHPVA